MHVSRNPPVRTYLMQAVSKETAERRVLGDDPQIFFLQQVERRELFHIDQKESIALLWVGKAYLRSYLNFKVMSNNPNAHFPSKPSQGPPAWLFSNNSIKSSVPLPSADTPSTMAKKAQKAAKPAKPTAPSTSRGETPPAQLMDLVESFLTDQGFDNAHREFQKQRAKKGWKEQGTKKHKDKTHHSLVSVFQTWKTFASQGNTPVLPKEDPMEKITKVSSSSSDSDSSDDSSSESESDSDDVAMADAPAAEESSSSESSSSEDSDSGSESDSESESDEETKPVKTAAVAVKNGVNPLKRKAESDSESSSESDSDDDMSDSSSDDGRPKAKRAKATESSDESSSSSSSSSDSSEDESSEDEVVKAKPKPKPDNDESSSSSESESDESDSESDSEPEVDLKEAAKVPLPESESSSSESESESDSDDKKVQKQAKDSAMNGSGSDTSVTLDQASLDAPLPPDPTALKSNNRGKNDAKIPKGTNQPFSRIRKDIAVDPRLASNAYVSHEYGEKAHQDLVVTKGKGFTKEKNKKKRGSYKGGPLDIHKSRSIKFED
ncbi:hypothetical protein F5Y05DRAFT_372720 [Hypoxylon sp. FL0543]|nr:hypothetical protein F5Y05DRAFT_372720 [Hypoxylon sp. FL0543]